MSLTLAQAADHAQKAVARAASRGLAASAAVLDAGFHVKAAMRADGAGPATMDIAIAKARAALYFGCSSRQIADALAGNPAAIPSVLATLPLPVVFLPGAILLHDAAGAITGAIGVAGGPPDDDEWAASVPVG